MLSLSENLSYYICQGNVDLRKGMDRLADIVQREMQRNPRSGEVFIFLSKSRKTIKLLHYQRGGFVLYIKRLDDGKFLKPIFNEDRNCYELSWTNFVMLLEGIVRSFMKV